jgi:hypothetical protein
MTLSKYVVSTPVEAPCSGRLLAMLSLRCDSQPHCATRLDLCLCSHSSSYRVFRRKDPNPSPRPRDQQRRYLAGSARCEADGGSHVATPRLLSHIMAITMRSSKRNSAQCQRHGKLRQRRSRIWLRILLETSVPSSWPFAADRSQRYGRSAPYSRYDIQCFVADGSDSVGLRPVTLGVGAPQRCTATQYPGIKIQGDMQAGRMGMLDCVG